MSLLTDIESGIHSVTQLVDNALPDIGDLLQRGVQALGLPPQIGEGAALAYNVLTGNIPQAVVDGTELLTGTAAKATSQAGAAQSGTVASKAADPGPPPPPPPTTTGSTAKTASTPSTGSTAKTASTPSTGSTAKTASTSPQGSASAAAGQPKPKASSASTKTAPTGTAPATTATGATASQTSSKTDPVQKFFDLSDEDLMKAVEQNKVPPEVLDDPSSLMMLQQRMDQYNELMTLISTIMKDAHDMHMSIISNVRA